MSERKYITRTMTVSLSLPENVSDKVLGDLQAGITAYAGSMFYVQGATVEIDAPPSKYDFSPEITGRVDAGGRVSAFRIPLEDDSVRYSQWGADNTVLWPRTDLMEVLSDAAREWWLDNRPAPDEDDEGEEA